MVMRAVVSSIIGALVGEACYRADSPVTGKASIRWVIGLGRRTSLKSACAGRNDIDALGEIGTKVAQLARLLSSWNGKLPRGFVV
jgi:hypothetical protein